ncbi:class I SAM-dependent methyltransferase [Okibacterium endophyticum]
MGTHVRDAYSRRAAEYSEIFGSITAAHPSDRQLVESWAAGIDGPVIDAGCGPGQWTNHLAEQGIAASGVDLVPEFIARARASYPGIPYRVGSLDDLDVATGSAGGVLSWYSLIHLDPDLMQVPLVEFARVIRPGGGLLLGFVEGPAIEKFDHAVVDAYSWPVEMLGDELRSAGFEVVEAHTRTGPGYRPHGAIAARRVGGDAGTAL